MGSGLNQSRLFFAPLLSQLRHGGVGARRERPAPGYVSTYGAVAWRSGGRFESYPWPRDSPVAGPASIARSISAAPSSTMPTTQYQNSRTMIPPSEPYALS